MSERSRRAGVWTPLTIVALYAFFGILWILLSDRLLYALFTDPNTLTNLQTMKGWFYVLLTALLLYLLIDGMYCRLKITHDHLIEEKNYSHNLIHQLPIGLALCRMDGQLVDINPAYAAIIGRSIEETLALSYWDITPNTYAEQEQAQLDSLQKSGRYGPYEKEYLHKDGHLVPVRLSGLVVERRGEKLIWSSVEDITERTKINEALRLSEEKFAKTFHNSPDAIALTSLPDGKFIEVNERFLDLSGYQHDEILGRTTLDLGLWGKQSDRQRYLDTLQKQHRAMDIETEFHKKSGDIIQCMISGEVIESQSGNFILNVIRDITEPKKAAAEIQRINKELHTINRIIMTCSTTLDTEELLNKVMDEALQITGLEGGTICFISPEETLDIAAHRATSEATIIDLTTHAVKVGDCLCGKCARDLQPLILPDRQAVLKFSTREATRNEDIHFHAAFPLISGERCVGVLCIFTRTDAKPSEHSLQLLKTVSAQIGMAIDNAQLYQDSMKHAVTLEDKVQQRTAELDKTRRALLNLVEDLNIANEKLQELDRMKSMFIASMSHELRTPLNSIIGFSSILADAWLGPVNQEQQENLNAILDSGKHLLAMINDIIDLSKIEADLLEIIPESFDLEPLVAEAIKMVANSAGGKGLAIIVDVAPLQMHTDRRRLLQCLLNLLTNAVKFTDQGEIVVTAQVSAAIQGSPMLKLAVRDTGIGIRPEERGLLFKPFGRLHSSGDASYPGTGLGLYLTQKLVQDVLGGEISLLSDFGQGSTFTLHIPVMIDKKSLPGTMKEHVDE